MCDVAGECIACGETSAASVGTSNKTCRHTHRQIKFERAAVYNTDTDFVIIMYICSITVICDEIEWDKFVKKK